MIRRDYILRMIEEFLQALSRIKALKRDQLSQEAAVTLDEEFKRLTGDGGKRLTQLTETKLLALLMKGEPTQVIHTKTLLLAALFKEAAEVAALQNQPEESRNCHLKGLHLLLHALGRGESEEMPDYVPKVAQFVTGLAGAPLPFETDALLMHHYERTGQFSKAEDSLFAMLEVEPENRRIIEFGISFYERLLIQSDANLSLGNLPRTEVEAGLAELRQKSQLLSSERPDGK